MSALNIAVRRDSVILVTDGAVYSDEGVVAGFPTKAVALPSLPAVLATRGTPWATPLFAHLIGMRFQTFDAIVAGIEDVIPGIHERVRSMCPQGDVDQPVVIGGWSHERNRPEAYLLFTAKFAPGMNEEEDTAKAITSPIYKLHRLSNIVISPFVAGYVKLALKQDMDESNLLRSMTALLELQRKNFYRSPKGEPFSGVGGYGLVSIVTRDNITQKIFHRWPEDRVGKCIEKSSTTVPVSGKITGPGSMFADASEGAAPGDINAAKTEANSAIELPPVDVHSDTSDDKSIDDIKAAAEPTADEFGGEAQRDRSLLLM
jgi:hypothetical protein